MSLPITIVQAASLEVRLDAVTERTLMRCGYKNKITPLVLQLSKRNQIAHGKKLEAKGDTETELMIVLIYKRLSTHPIGVDAFNQRACPLAGLHSRFEDPINVNMVALDVGVLVCFRGRPADEHGFVQLPLQRELPRCRH